MKRAVGIAQVVELLSKNETLSLPIPPKKKQKQKRYYKNNENIIKK
jgi:hypothetical protein